MRSFKVIFINSAAREIREVVCRSGDDIRKLVGGYIEHVLVEGLPNDSLYVDEEGLLKAGTHFFEWRNYPQPLAGDGVIVGEEVLDDEGDLVCHDPVRITLAEVRALVTFRDRAYVESWGKANASDPAIAITTIGPDGKPVTEVISTMGRLIADLPKPDLPTWKPEVQVDGKWTANSLVFAAREEAETYAADLFMRWTQPTAYRAVESILPVNSAYQNGKLIEVEP